MFAGGNVTCPVDDPAFLSNAVVDVRSIPEKYYSSDNEGLYFFQLGKIGDKGPGAGCDGPISKITRDLRVCGTGDSPVTVIDVKAGMEDSARGVITSMDWIVTVVDPTSASIQIAEDIRNLVSRIQAGELPAIEHLQSPGLIEQAKRVYREARTKGTSVILNKIRDERTESYLSRRLEEKGLRIIGVLNDDSSISLSWLEGRPLEVNQELTSAVERLKRAVGGQTRNRSR